MSHYGATSYIATIEAQVKPKHLSENGEKRWEIADFLRDR